MRSLSLLWRNGQFRQVRRSFSTLPINVPNEKLIKVKVNGNEIQVPDNSTIMQACSLSGVDIPRFCYHERLGIAGNCRMCLVEVNGGPKLVASCAAPVMPEMRIVTDCLPVKKAREGVMEFLLANHPLDCPICDQGGECDLQDQAMAFGSDRSRFQIVRNGKRAVEDKDFGPLIKTSMNRCIHCTRCVRFANEVAGVQELGTTGRGNDMQIGTYISKMIDSPLSSNIIDLCPVGALTSKPYAFTARPWELRGTDSIDVMDAVGANIKIDSRGLEVMRILPRLNEDINEEWLSDKSRFACDGLRQQRIVQPLIREDSSIFPVTWEEALSLISDKLMATTPNAITGVIGRFADVESTYSLKVLLEKIGAAPPIIDNSKNDVPSSFAELVKELRFNSTIQGIEQADAILLIGCNPKLDAPLLNARIRKTWLRRDVSIGVIGENADLTYEYEHISNSLEGIEMILNNKTHFAEKLINAKNPLIIVGQNSLFLHPNGTETIQLVATLSQKIHNTLFQENWNGLNILPLSASYTGATQMGLLPGRMPKNSKFVYLLNSDDVDKEEISKDAFIVYQGHHGDVGAAIANVILPSTTYTEKDAIYVNMEGRPQCTRAAVPPPGESREDWSILRALSEFTETTLPWDDPITLRQNLSIRFPALTKINDISPSKIANIIKNIDTHKFTKSKNVDPVPYETVAMKDYYLTDCISRNSPTMAKCSLAFTSKSIKDSDQLEAL